ncbi:membrane protein [Granulicella rosea]|uniref:Membrane protein n=1 Tax=Granulicella rosea TaxID=474952 RepID=A0A239LD30_9BACT|nr:YihY/virulence factor BrkB family protein [Granulicella rosea]SNT27549.1 membrane protein [Granulicella rosea]
MRKDHTLTHIDPQRQRIWDAVSAFPIGNLWDFQGVPPMLIARRTWHSIIEDNLLSRAAELGYYFLFALFPALISASAVLGLMARSATDIYVKLLNYMAVVVPHDALGIVLDTFNQTAANSTSGKVTFGIAFAVWSASVGFTAIQDTLNTVYKVKETRPYWKARGSAMLVTLLLGVLVTLTLCCLLAGTALSHLLRRHIYHYDIGMAGGIAIHLVFDLVTLGMLNLLFAVIYYFAPDVKNKRWRLLTPGAALGILGWILASLALRLYLFYFNSYSLTYGSLGAVIILLTWFYLTGLMLLIGAEINSEIEAAATERRLKAAGAIPPAVTSDPDAPVPAATS